MIQNGVKPWIVSKEDEQTHLTSLNSLRLFQGFAPPLVVNGQRERTVMDQIQHALKVTIDRISRNQGQNRDHGGARDENYLPDDYSTEDGDNKSHEAKRERSKGGAKKEQVRAEPITAQ